MSNVLIFGGSGIIGSEVTAMAIERGNQVTIVNRGRRKDFMHPRAKLIVADLRNDPVFEIQNKIVDSYDAVIDTISYNTEELNRNLEIVKGKFKQYFLFSTAVVYKTKEGRYTEDDAIGNDDWSYSIKKIECERVLRERGEERGFYWTIVRPYITYGKSRIPLQFGPIEYYTVINRAKHGKVIPVYSRETNCTLTYSKDFAVGLVGLIGNPKAFNQVFNITGQYETTWNQILDDTMTAFQTPYETIPLDENEFRSVGLMDGLDASEVYGDKGRNMLFDNGRIKAVVPAFEGKTEYKAVLPEIVRYFGDERKQIINYAWDARVDRMLSKTGKLNKQQEKNLKYAPGQGATSKDKTIYWCHRYDLLYLIYRVGRKIKNTVFG